MATLVIRTPAEVSIGHDVRREAGYPAGHARISQVSGSSNDLTYKFPYAPVEAEFTDLGNEYAELERPGTYAIVNRRRPKLMRVSFEFRVAHRPSNGLQSIERDLIFLRMMADANVPVAVVGLGTFFNAKAGFQGNTLFRINSLTVRVVRRGPDNVPWQADCNIELIEDRNTLFFATTLAPIVYEPEPAPATANSGSSGNGGGGSPAPKSTPSGGGGGGSGTRPYTGSSAFYAKGPTTAVGTAPPYRPKNAKGSSGR